MARRIINHASALERHVPEDEESIKLFCPLLKSKGTRDVVVCLYKCPRTLLIKCEEYLRIYPELLGFDIDPKYIEKYGALSKPLPASLRKRRVRHAPAQ